MLFQCTERLLPTYITLKLGTTGTAEDGAALLDNATDRACVQCREVARNQPCLAQAYTKDLPSKIESTARYCANDRIHIGGVAATC